MDDPQRRRTLSFFVAARAVGALILTLHRRGYLPTVPHFMTLTFGVCQALIILAMTKFPGLLPQGYYRSILSWSMYYSEEKLQVLIIFDVVNGNRHDGLQVSCNLVRIIYEAVKHNVVGSHKCMLYSTSVLHLCSHTGVLSSTFSTLYPMFPIYAPRLMSLVCLERFLLWLYSLLQDLPYSLLSTFAAL